MKTQNQIYAITKIEDRIFSFLLHNQKAVEIHCDTATRESLLGNIYIGKIKNIARNIGAAFVEISPGQTCYLPLKELENPIYTRKGNSKEAQAGDELLVQVCREEIKSKFPAVTTNLVLHGKYILLTTGKRQRSASSKLSSKDRVRLLGLLETLIPESSDYGWLMRTNAAGASEEQLERDIKRLQQQYEQLMGQLMYRTCFTCLWKTPCTYLTRIADLYEAEADRIVTDDPILYQELQEYIAQYQPEDIEKLSFYEDKLLPMKKLYSLEHQLKEALQEKVWMKSGGYLVIQPTEALTVIDVNSGKYEGGKKKEQSFLKINLEAAGEIARQIRLRNLSGIILIDFINMELAESNHTLLAFLEKELKKDPIPTTLVDMTKLSLVEITRKKKEKPLLESVGHKENCCKSRF